jgi:uncharacterized protein YfdQ (DUF2303 family)
MTDQGTAEVIRDLAQEAAEPAHITIVPNRLDGVALASGMTLHEIDLDKYSPIPYRKTGTVALRDVDSFAGYVNRHRDPHGTTLWGNAKAGTIVAVLNDHEDDHLTAADDDPPVDTGVPGWGDHRTVLQLEATPDWLGWLALDGKLGSQEDFAEHLEDLAHTVAIPTAADMLELAQHFTAARNVDFKAGKRLGSGETTLLYDETITASAGQHRQIAIPNEIELAVTPFYGTEPVRLVARFRYRINNGALKIGYKLIRPDIVLEAAFTAASERVSELVDLPVLAGTPRQSR